MIAVYRFRVPVDGADGFAVDLALARDLLAGRPGFLTGSIGRNVDDPELWALVTHWRDVGAYRRALSAYEVKAGATAVLSRMLDEPTGFEVVDPPG